MRGRAALLVMLCVLLASTVACASRPGAAGADAAPTAAAVMDGDPQRPAAARWLRTELYFATGRADGPSARGVSPVAWQEFLDEAVTPRFPDGFTVHDAYGQWRSRDGTRIGRLHSKVIVILHPDSEDARSRVEAVRRAFKARTGQDSVLRATAPVEVSF